MLGKPVGGIAGRAFACHTRGPPRLNSYPARPGPGQSLRFTQRPNHEDTHAVGCDTRRTFSTGERRVAVRIRLKRLGRRHLPFYRIAVMDSRSPRDGRSIEDVGHYDPMVPDKSQRVNLNMERIDYWISVGAQPSDKVAVLIDKVKKNRFGTASEPPPMTAPKELPPPPEPSAEEAAPTDEAEDAAAADEEATTEEAPAEE
ncbi:MAG TPA: 30S ribosomal protein S16, partial [Planctomycetaceae bacterium]|nr:30S ribosomal protein S16 [Planctomycetaceae bacterium]